METVEEVMQELQSKAKPDQIEGMAKFAIVGDQRMGVSVPDMRKIAKAVGALIACLAWHDKQAGDEEFIKYFPIIVAGSTDDRNFVKKAVNWALRNIGKRNQILNEQAILCARQIQEIDSKSARWIASNARRELESDKIQERLRKKGK